MPRDHASPEPVPACKSSDALTEALSQLSTTNTNHPGLLTKVTDENESLY